MPTIPGRDKVFMLESESMPCGPRDFYIPSWPYGDLGALEAGEAAARLLRFSQDMGVWVGVNLDTIMEALKAECAYMRRAVTHTALDDREQSEYRKKMVGFIILCVLTLGIVTFVKGPPKRPVRRAPEFRSCAMLGPYTVLVGLDQLLRTGMVAAEIHERDGVQDQIFFPTPLLIEVVRKYRLN